MYSSLSGSTFPPSYPWAKMCTRLCQYLKDSSAQVYDPICRSSPGLGKASHLDLDHHNTQIADRSLVDEPGLPTGRPYSPSDVAE